MRLKIISNKEYKLYSPQLFNQPQLQINSHITVFVLIFSATCPKAKFFNNFHLSESSFTCLELRASGCVWRLQSSTLYYTIWSIFQACMWFFIVSS